MNVFDIIKKCAQVPSFSSYEERIHSVIYEILAPAHVEITQVADNNLLVCVPGKKDAPAVALTAHLDKINHWGEEFPQSLPCEISSQKIVGQMDDAAGVGICLFMALESAKYSFPPLLILLSEMEESTGLKKHPHLLKSNDLYPGMGAVRLAEYLLQENMLPSCAITIDTTPEFREQPGIAFYDNFWHLQHQFTPSEVLSAKIEKIKHFFLQKDPEIIVSNANNDYIEYGLTLNKNGDDIPSVALEPAIHPYHQAPEGVHCGDIEKMVHLLRDFLQDFTWDDALS
ncbi:hypothetical protein [Candidatus Uabimicrobium amorphum]|uniref:Peptidase M28 domain-containing protein n=1 Tax=Uabimicrobium amorphum TaxID=2596890 RepID=A0A5S9F1E8_UABAM|nr:hypothetical protein [Candidatus Uabimicrobium amorphum]BBM82537.1 hypothetical protein UABAM_00880 [Candidatus Uabimicrobium amorphum]